MEDDGFTLVTRKKKHKKPKTKAGHLADGPSKVQAALLSHPTKRKSHKEDGGFKYEVCSRQKQSRRHRRGQQRKDSPADPMTSLLQKLVKFRRIMEASTLLQEIRMVLRERLIQRGAPWTTAHVTAYGVGNFAENSSGLFQLALVDVTRAVLSDLVCTTATTPENKEVPSQGAPVNATFYDPLTTSEEAAFLSQALKMEVLDKGNDEGRRKLSDRADLHVVFMPHCERWLYENFLMAHSVASTTATRMHGSDCSSEMEGGDRLLRVHPERMLNRIVLIGNSFRVFRHQARRSKEELSAQKHQDQQQHAATDSVSAPGTLVGEQPTYTAGHHETKLAVATKDPYWTALSGLVVHQWAQEAPPAQ